MADSHASPRPKNDRQTEEKRLSEALRSNLQRRKAAPRPSKPAPDAASDAK